MLSSFKSKIGNVFLPIHLWAFSNGVVLQTFLCNSSIFRPKIWCLYLKEVCIQDSLLDFWAWESPLVDLHLIFEICSLKSQVRRTWFLSISNLIFTTCSLQKSILKSTKNQVRRIWFFKLDISKIKCRSTGVQSFSFSLI